MELWAALSMEAKDHNKIVDRIAARVRSAIKNVQGVKVVLAKGTTMGKERAP